MNIRLIGTTALLASLAAAGCATTSPGSGYGYGNAAPVSSSAACYDCGTVTRIEVASTSNSNVPNATGAVLGGIVGAVAGREISDKTGGSAGNKNVATAAGAVAGAVAGNAIQNHAQAQGVYNVYVRMNDGRTTVVTQSDLGGIREGSYVRVSNGRAYLQ
ncbi:glycine zipper 2TM domain-containing protein [Cognatiluteimonas telluris]|uniref:glycine zipper 2TM domain-containing protein n=1 Tax=Cognatiluteimonas telluris TaxID=1104775 RepID=UPI0014095C47|nr:glycine zipper 2TM domain-containing protein [Lysobacter telluris]